MSRARARVDDRCGRVAFRLRQYFLPDRVPLLVASMTDFAKAVGVWVLTECLTSVSGEAVAGATSVHPASVRECGRQVPPQVGPCPLGAGLSGRFVVRGERYSLGESLL